MLTYFAHNGIEHATANEATQHADASKWPLFMAYSLVILAVLVVATKVLSKPAKPVKKETKS